MQRDRKLSVYSAPAARELGGVWTTLRRIPVRTSVARTDVWSRTCQIGGVSDAGRQTVLGGGCARSEVTAEAPAHDSETVGIHPGPSQGEVDNRRDDRLPVGPEGYPALPQHPTLPGPVEGQTVVAAL